MENWKTLLKADPISWLLEEDNPSVRYFTLKDLLDIPEYDASVQAARREIMEKGAVCDILEQQRKPEYLKAYPRFYTYKYKGLVWSLILLAEVGADRTQEIEAQCEYILTNCREPSQGGFSQNTAIKTGDGRMTEVIPCLSGNMVFALLRFGYLEDARLQEGIDWLTTYMRFNDGVELDPQVMPYSRYEPCWGRHTCHMGIVKTLKAFGEISPERRSDAVSDIIEKAAEFVLIHRIYKRSHNFSRTSKPGWLKFGFPLMYQTDVLEILDILTGLGIRDSRMDEALELVLSKQDECGRWKLENTYNSDRLIIPFGQKDEPSKWLTLRALRVLKRVQA